MPELSLTVQLLSVIPLGARVRLAVESAQRPVVLPVVGVHADVQLPSCHRHRRFSPRTNSYHTKIYDTVHPLGGSNTHRLNVSSAGGTWLWCVSGMERRTVKGGGAQTVGVVGAAAPAALNTLLRQGEQPVLRAQHYKTLE